MEGKEIIELMKQRIVTREELRALLGAESDSAARRWVRDEVKPFHPVICTAGIRGYKIAVSAADLELAKACSRENHRKAATLHRNTNTLDKWIIREEAHGAVTGTLPFEDEIRAINADVIPHSDPIRKVYY